MFVNANDELRDQLLREGVLPPADVEAAYKQAEEVGLDLEIVLRKSHRLSDTHLTALRALRQGVTYCNIGDFLPALSNAALVSEELARRHVMFPLFQCDGVITLGIKDPNDLTAIDQVRRLTRQEVDVVLAGETELLGLIERTYGTSRYIEETSVADSLTELSDAAALEDNQPVIRLVENLINEAVRQGASDIHIEPTEHELRIRVRVDGVLREIAAPPLALHRALVSRIKVIAKLDISKTRTPQDGAFHHRNVEHEVVIRVSILPSVFGEAVVLRILRNESDSVTLNDLGMPQRVLNRFRAVISNAHGMILVSGPTGSGKSTTLYAGIKSIVCPQKNIIAIEDPVEYRNSRIRQVQVNTEADLTFANGLRSVLRQDPDVIMVGEIRDRETAQIAVQAALTGHLLLSTVHTNDSISAIARLRDLGVPEYLISSSLLAVLAQRLCRRVCPECKAPESPPEFLLRAIGLESAEQLDFEPMRGKGCRRCVGSGYVGRVGLYELFELNETFSEMVVRGESSEAIRAAARAAGMQFMVQDGVEKVRAGLTTVEEVARVAGRA